jgi:F-type H+-transporting ATPase subunit b
VNVNLTLIGQSIAFVIFAVFCMKYVWPLLINMMAEREKKIADGLEASDRAAKDLELAQERATEQMKEAKSQAAEIIDEAKKRGQQIVEEAKQKAIEEANRQKAAAEAEIAQQLNRAKEELRSKVAMLALSGAEKVLQSSIDQKAHGKLVDDLAAQL